MTKALKKYIIPRRIYLNFALIFAAFNLFSFLMFFIPYYVLEVEIESIEYARIFLTKFIEFGLPVMGGALLLASGAKEKFGTKLLNGLFISLPRLVYLLPYYYLYFIAYGYDSIESIGLSSLVTLFGILVMICHMLVICYVGVLAEQIFYKTKRRKEKSKNISNSQDKVSPEAVDSLNSEMMNEFLSGKNPFIFSTALAIGLFSASMVEFVIALASEIISTVEYLISYAGQYRIEEIIYMTVSYLFILFETLVVYAICYFVVKKVYRATEGKETEKNERII